MGPFCINCVHHQKRHDGYDVWSECGRLLSDHQDAVTGEYTDRVGRSCASERRKDKSLFGRVKCGPAGRFFKDSRP